MPRYKAMKSFRVGESGKHVRPGDTFDVSDATGSLYEIRGMAAKVAETGGKVTKTAKNEAAAAGPLSSTGGPTGAAKRVSSSPAVKARKARRSRK